MKNKDKVIAEIATEVQPPLHQLKEEIELV